MTSLALSCNFSAHILSYHFLFDHSRLGHKIQGVLCDGHSNEVVASTVVNCLRINEGRRKKQIQVLFFFVPHTFPKRCCLPVFTGTITIVREGCVPAAKVHQIFDRVKNSAV